MLDKHLKSVLEVGFKYLLSEMEIQGVGEKDRESFESEPIVGRIGDKKYKFWIQMNLKSVDES